LREAVIKTIAAYTWTTLLIKTSMVGKVPYSIRAIVVSESFNKTTRSREVFNVFEHMRDILMHSIIGVSFPGYLKCKQITEKVGHVGFMMDGVIRNTIIQIENLVGDMEKPFE